MNKGIIGAILVAAVFLLLLWRLAKKHCATEVICLVALTLYLFMENKPFWCRPIRFADAAGVFRQPRFQKSNRMNPLRLDRITFRGNAVSILPFCAILGVF